MTHLGAVVAVSLLATIVPLITYAGQTGKMSRVGILEIEGSLTSPRVEAFRQELRSRGWIEGQNLVIESRIGPVDQFPAFADQLVQRGLDVIFAPSTPAVRAARGITKSIPIVFALTPDPVTTGFASSLNRPGGNVTGPTPISSDLVGKQLELLRTVLPRLTRVALLMNPQMSYSAGMVRQAEIAARGMNLRLIVAKWDDPNRLVDAFEHAIRERAQALVIVPNPLNISNMAQIEDFVAKRRLPTIGIDGSLAGRPFLMAYGPDFVHQYRQAAGYVDRILKGAKPADMPIEQPTRIELAINMKAARELGLTVPPALVLRADRIIE